MRHKIILWVGIGLACCLFISGCGAAPTETPAASVTPSPTVLPPASTISATVTSALIPTEAATCPPINDKVTLAEARDKDAASQQILDYLDQGGDPEKLADQVKLLGPIIDSTQFIVKDVNNDKVNEVVAALNFGVPEGGRFEDRYAVLRVYRCVNGAYRFQDITSGGLTNYSVLFIGNLIDSNTPDLLIKDEEFNVGWCLDWIYLYTSPEQGWVASFQSDFVPCSGKIDLMQSTDGKKQLITQGYRECYVGFCFYRREKRITYEFQENRVVQTAYELLPSPYRYHKLEDAGIALEKGNFEEAIKLYNEAATDSHLADAPTLHEVEVQNTENLSDEAIAKRAHAYQTAYGYFREYALLLYLGHVNEADALFKTMKVLYPLQAQANELVDLASYLKGQLDIGSSFENACIATNTHLLDKYGWEEDSFVWKDLIQWDDYQLPGFAFAVCPELK